MQIASIVRTEPNAATVVDDVVPPSQLFRVAADRLARAADAMFVGARRDAPAARLVDAAISDALGGTRILRSALVPGMPFYQRRAAAAAIDFVQSGVELLERYRDHVAGLAPFRVGRVEVPMRVDRMDVPIQALRHLADGRAELLAAVGVLTAP